MDKKNFTLLPLLALFFSPLIHASTESIQVSRITFGYVILFLIAFSVFFSLYQFRVHRLLSILSLGAASIVLISFLLGMYPAKPFALIVYSMGILFFIFSFTVSSNKKIKAILPFLLIGCIGLYAQWGIAQFIVQNDLGMVRVGESVLNIRTPGVASFSIGTQKFIRSYGPFAHANAFGGVLLIGTILLFMQRNVRGAQQFSHSLWLVLGLGILLSFSRTAIIGLVILIAIGLLKNIQRKTIAPLCIAMLVFLPILFTRSSDPQSVAVADRVMGASWFADIISSQLVVRGLGIGNYSLALSDYLSMGMIPHDPWDIAPIHSVPLLLISELGLLLFIPLFIIIILFFRKRGSWIFLILIPALFFDHYFATQLGPLAFLMTTAGIVVQ